MIRLLTSLPSFVTKFGKQESGQHHGRYPSSSPYRKNSHLCQNNRTVSLISHPSKALLKIILGRLKSRVDEIVAEEQAGFRSGRSTMEQVLNDRLLCDKYSQHNQNLYHQFIDFKNLRFTDDIDGLAGSEEELAALANILDATSRKFGMEISAEKTKLMTNSTQSINI